MTPGNEQEQSGRPDRVFSYDRPEAAVAAYRKLAAAGVDAALELDDASLARAVRVAADQARRAEDLLTETPQAPGGWIDISRSLSPSSPHWPGDTPFAVRSDAEIASGGFHVSAVGGSLHIATHVDAPSHCMVGGDSVDQLAPSVFIGPAEIIDLQGASPVTAADLAERRRGTMPRLLLKNAGGLAPSAARMLLDWQVALVGCEGASIAVDAAELEVHRLLLGGAVVILEGLDLSAVDAGFYEFIGLPLRIAGAEASWVRAVVRALA